MQYVTKHVFKLLFVTLFFGMGTALMSSEKSASGGKKVFVLDSSAEWPRGFAARIYKVRHHTDSWNYDPLWYDLLSRNGKRKRMETEDNGEERDGGIGKRLFVARVGKRIARIHWARVG